MLKTLQKIIQIQNKPKIKIHIPIIIIIIEKQLTNH